MIYPDHLYYTSEGIYLIDRLNNLFQDNWKIVARELFGVFYTVKYPCFESVIEKCIEKKITLNKLLKTCVSVDIETKKIVEQWLVKEKVAKTHGKKEKLCRRISELTEKEIKSLANILQLRSYGDRCYWKKVATVMGFRYLEVKKWNSVNRLIDAMSKKNMEVWELYTTAIELGHSTLKVAVSQMGYD